MKRFLLGMMIIIAVLLLVVAMRTAIHQPVMHQPAKVQPPTSQTAIPAIIPLNESLLALRLSQAIQFKTVSFQSNELKQPAEFSGFIDWVRSTYPLVNQQLEYTQLNESMLYRWVGSDESLQPILVTGHYDVVPVIPGSEDIWEHPPFAGVIDNGVIWGRGALDDKSGVLGILEAVTYLLESGHKPARTVYLSFGHDEEIAGSEGAGAIVSYLEGQGVQLAWSLDEGSFVFDGIIPGLDSLAAMINVAEKGSVTLDIIATAEGGHSSMPPRNNAVVDLAQAITKLSDNPLPGGLEGIASTMFDNISRHMSWVNRALFANQWLFGPLIESQLSNVATTNAMLRTTTAPTMLAGSVKTNVLPIEAVATVNFRIHPRDSVDSVEAYVSDLVGSESIRVHSRGGANASAVSDWNAPGFRLIGQSMREVYGDIAVTPGLMIAASDSRHYGKVSDNAYRFNPFRLTPDLLTGFHGTNEKISVVDYAQGVRGYIGIIRHGTTN